MNPSRPIHTIFVAIGANLPGHASRPPLETCLWAAGALDSLPGVHVEQVSRWYRSAPIGDSGKAAIPQPDYVNGVARLCADTTPEALLAGCQAIEAQAGRVRGERNAPRTLDLDIIAFGDWVRNSPDPILPHPRAHLRAFVLLPLADVAPFWVHPVLGQTVGEIMAGLRDQEIGLI